MPSIWLRLGFRCRYKCRLELRSFFSVDERRISGPVERSETGPEAIPSELKMTLNRQKTKKQMEFQLVASARQKRLVR